MFKLNSEKNDITPQCRIDGCDIFITSLKRGKITMAQINDSNTELNNNIIIYENQDGKPNISVRIEGETVWLTQSQLIELFQSSKPNISEHIKNIYTEGELTKEATVRKFRTVQKEGDRDVSRNIEYYNERFVLI